MRRRKIYRPAGADAGYLQRQSTETLLRMLEAFSGESGFQGFATSREMRNRRMEQAHRIAIEAELMKRGVDLTGKA